MLRTFSSLAALAVALSIPTAPAAAKAPAETTIVQAAVVGGPTPRAGRFTFEAQLVSAGAPVAGVPLILSIRGYGETTFTDVSLSTTDATGRAVATVTLLKRAHLRWHFDGDEKYAAATGTALVQRVATRASITLSDKTPTVGQWVTVRGRTMPVAAGRRVWLFRGFSAHGAPLPPGPKPVQLAEGKVRADGTYKLRVRFPSAGDRRLFVDVAKGDGNARGYSRARVVRVR